MITVNGHDFISLADPIYVNGQQVLEAYVNGQYVYPESSGHPDLHGLAMWFFVRPVVSKYAPDVVDHYGAYILLDPNEHPFYRACFYVDTTRRPYFYRRAFISFEGFVQSKSTVMYVPFVSMGENVVADGLTSDGINTFALRNYTSDGKTYYANDSDIGMNLADAQGNYLLDFRIGSSGTCPVFYSSGEALSYVLGN